MIALLTVLLSFAGAAACGVMPARNHGRIRWVALGTALAGLVTAIVCCVQYSGDGEFAAKLQADWIPSLGVQFLTGYDGISLPLLIVTGLVAVCGVLFTWNLDHRVNEFYAYYFALIGGVYGVFLSLDLFLLFVFYEIAIVPKYFLIAIWGGAKRQYAAMKLVLYSFGGSALVLLGMLALAFNAGTEPTFSILQLSKAQFSPELQVAVFPVLFLGFAILAGMWPFHTWAPQGHSAAPTAASMLLAGVVMKLGAYGCLRVAVGLLPDGAQDWAVYVAVFAVINILYGALAALRQEDFKYVIGYSSVSHMGFVLLGIGTLHLAIGCRWLKDVAEDGAAGRAAGAAARGPGDAGERDAFGCGQRRAPGARGAAAGQARGSGETDKARRPCDRRASMRGSSAPRRSRRRARARRRAPPGPRAPARVVSRRSRAAAPLPVVVSGCRRPGGSAALVARA